MVDERQSQEIVHLHQSTGPSPVRIRQTSFETRLEYSSITYIYLLSVRVIAPVRASTALFPLYVHR
jgi:hypothetical protein